MKRLNFRHSCLLKLDAEVTRHTFTLRILPHDDPAQTIHIENCVVEPVADHSLQTDGFGNRLYVGSTELPHDSLRYEVSGIAEVDCIQGRGTICNEVFRYHSPLTTPADPLLELHEQAGAVNIGSPVQLFERAVELQHLAHGSIAYQQGVTGNETTAAEALLRGQGVCQDFAHIFISLLRMDDIPARYVNGLMEGEGATHAWVEFYDGMTWWGLDPTNDCEAGDCYIAIARGRDSADCPIESGVFQGTAIQRQKITASVRVIS